MSRNEEFDNGHTPKCEDCGKSLADNHFHVEMDPEEGRHMKAWHEAVQLSHMGAEVERTRTVNLAHKADLLDHLGSNNGHMEGHHYAMWRNSYEDEDIPGVRPKGDDDFQLTHKELKAIHEHLHRTYPDDEHTTLGEEHFHH